MIQCIVDDLCNPVLTYIYDIVSYLRLQGADILAPNIILCPKAISLPAEITLDARFE